MLNSSPLSLYGFFPEEAVKIPDEQLNALFVS